MNWLIIAALVLVALVVLALLLDNHGLFALAEKCAVAAAVGGLVWAAVAISALLNWWSFAPDMREMAAVREATQRLGCHASEDVLGKATDWNAKMASAKAWNARWLADPLHNDGVDTVTAIPLPHCTPMER